jgi:hypothetical protein
MLLVLQSKIPVMAFIHPQIWQITQIEEKNLPNLRNLWIIFFISGIAVLQSLSYFLEYAALYIPRPSLWE